MNLEASDEISGPLDDAEGIFSVLKAPRASMR